ncbi:MAG: ACT domain-containing protein, partial [Rhodospirillales bacterium]|nr:ACT domain-containing protein [Rhodospirillales bacterium]
MPQVKAVVSVIGKDQKGVVARFATLLAEQGCNILDIEQQVVHGRFIMDMLIDLADLKASLDELITALLTLGGELEMQVRVALHDQRRQKRIAILVSKETHCFERLIEDWRAGRFRGEPICVLSNHFVLEPLAKEAGLPFEHVPSDDKQAHFDWLAKRLQHYEPDLVVLARYMQIVPPAIIEGFPYRIINIH